MKHLRHPLSPVKSLCGLPFGGWRKDGRRHKWPELSDVASCQKCNESLKAARKRGGVRVIAPVGAFTRR